MFGRREASSSSGEAFSGRAIQRRVLAEALQHPATLYPFAVCALAASYGLFVAPFVGGQPWALLAAAGTGLASAASFTWHYFIQGESSAREKARGLIESEQQRRQQVEAADLQEMRGALERELTEAGASDALQVLRDLATEYDGVAATLERQIRVDPLSLKRMEVSAAEAYRRGLDMLREAAELVTAIHATDSNGLTAEVEELEAEIGQLTKSGTQPERVRIKQQSLEAHRQTLELLERQTINAEAFLHEAQLAEEALRRARVMLPSVDWNRTTTAVKDVVSALEEPAAVGASQPRPARRHGEETHERYEAREVR